VASPTLPVPPPSTGILLQVDGLAPTLRAAGAPLTAFGVDVPNPDDLRHLLTQKLGFRTGDSLDLDRPCGLLVEAASATASASASAPAGVAAPSGAPGPRFAFWLATTSDAALAADLPVAPTGGFAVPAPLASLLKVAVAVPGGVAWASDPAYLEQVRGFVDTSLNDESAQPGVTLIVAPPSLTTLLDPIAARLGKRAQLDMLGGWLRLNEVERAAVTYRPEPDAVRLVVDLTPVAGSRMDDLLSGSSPSSPAPDGLAVPADYPVQATMGVSPELLSALVDFNLSRTTDKTVVDSERRLAKLDSGGVSIGLDLEGNAGFEQVVAVSCHEADKARQLHEAVEERTSALGRIFGMASATAAGGKVTVAHAAATIDGQAADELTIDLGKRGAYYEYLACPPGWCVLAVSPLAAHAKARLAQAVAAVVAHQSASPTPPMSDRDGIRETAALLGDVSHGLVYVDGEQIAAELLRHRLERQAKASGKPAASQPAASLPTGPSGKPGVGLSWTTDGSQLEITVAASVQMATDIRALYAAYAPSTKTP
jgi:hypothetical protein